MTEYIPDWRGKLEKRFRWSKLRFEWGRYCYVVHPVEGGKDIIWWKWEWKLKRKDK